MKSLDSSKSFNLVIVCRCISQQRDVSTRFRTHWQNPCFSKCHTQSAVTHRGHSLDSKLTLKLRCRWIDLEVCYWCSTGCCYFDNVDSCHSAGDTDLYDVILPKDIRVTWEPHFQPISVLADVCRVLGVNCECVLGRGGEARVRAFSDEGRACRLLAAYWIIVVGFISQVYGLTTNLVCSRGNTRGRNIKYFVSVHAHRIGHSLQRFKRGIGDCRRCAA